MKFVLKYYAQKKDWILAQNLQGDKTGFGHISLL